MIELPQSVPNLTEASQNLYELIKGRNLVVYPDEQPRVRPSPSFFRRLQIRSAVILVECGSPILPLHRNRLRPECPKEAFPLAACRTGG